MADDLRQRYAEAIAAKFTYPVYRCDRDGENERVENAEPADRIDQTPYVMATAGDGCRSFWTPTCAELGEVVAAARDGELERLRADIADLNDLIASERAIHEQWISRTEQAEAKASRAHALAERLAAEGEERASQAVTAEQAAAWKTQAHVARLFLAALDTDPGREPASPRHTGREEVPHAEA